MFCLARRVVLTRIGSCTARAELAPGRRILAQLALAEMQGVAGPGSKGLRLSSEAWRRCWSSCWLCSQKAVAFLHCKHLLHADLSSLVHNMCWGSKKKSFCSQRPHGKPILDGNMENQRPHGKPQRQHVLGMVIPNQYGKTR